ncbi:MAG: DMT family transporter [Pseudomonadota bacterium]
MSTLLIYAATVLIWGSTWIMIKFQLGIVPAQVSLVYRFALAAIALVIFAVWQRRRLRVPRRYWPMVATQGFFMFSANYYFVYEGTAFITSGLVAVLFTALVLMNAINERIFFGTPISTTGLVAGCAAIGGIGLMFWPEIQALSMADDTLKGIALVLCGALMGSFGNMAAIRNTRDKLPVVAVNALGMAFGGACSLILALINREPFVVDWSFSYVGSLLFLAIPGTAIAFGLYLTLLDRLGGTKAAYCSVMLPVVALILSTLFEGYEWSLLAFTGLVIAIAGNALALAEKPKAPPKSAA